MDQQKRSKLGRSRLATTCVLALLLSGWAAETLVAQSYSMSLTSGDIPGGAALSMNSILGGVYCELHVWGSFAGPNLSGEVWFESPSGFMLAWMDHETYTSHLVIRLEHDLQDFSPAGTYNCKARAWADSWPLGEPVAPIQVSVPGSTSVVYDAYDFQSFNWYSRTRVYQTKTSGGVVWDWDGATATESWGAWSPNGCSLPAIGQQSAETFDGGKFGDQYALLNHAPCNTSPNCQSSALQTMKVGGYTVKQHTVTYKCNQVNMP